jgi:hypothetical protein
MATNYENDERMQDVMERDAAALKEYETGMQGAINQNNAGLADIKNTLTQGQQKLEASANEQTEFAIDEIERQKEQTRQDYIKEQSGAYKDWQKQSDPYGVNAERNAAAGMSDTGYAESSQVSMYNQYQSRVTAARETFQRSMDNFNASITQARLQNNATLAQIAYETLVKQAEYAATFLMKNTELLTSLAQGKASMKQQSTQNYLSVLQQLQDEAQFNASLAENKRQHDETLAFQREQFNWQKQKAASSGGSSGGSSSIKKSSGSSKKSSSGSSGIVKDKQATQVSTKDSGGGEKNLPIDKKSVLSLGQGPMSAEKLNKLVNAGVVQEYVDDGKLKFKYKYKGKGVSGGGSGNFHVKR